MEGLRGMEAGERPDGVGQGLGRVVQGGAALVGDVTGAVRFGFTERTGGASVAPYDSLNLGAHVGDDPRAVAENRRRALALLGAAHLEQRLLVPSQVHGDRVVVVDAAVAADLASVREDIAQGADAIACTAADVPVLLCFADCAPVVLVAEDAFAVAHSGWKGTYAGIAGKTARVLARSSGANASSIRAYIGPHILGCEYEVSQDLLDRFVERFGPGCAPTSGARLLDLSYCIKSSLMDAGVPPENVHDTSLSTMGLPGRFYSYRREGGVCGRHGALAVRLS